MSLFDFFKNVFGFPKPHTPGYPSTSDPTKGSEFKKPVWIDEYVEEDDDISIQQYSAPMFPVLSDPLEIHRYFEQQMEYMQDMMRKFTFFPRSSIFDDNSRQVFGAIESPEPESRTLRDKYLKQQDDAGTVMRKDSDLDTRVGAEGLGSIMGEHATEHHNAPATPAPKFHFFGETIITKTVRKPNGTVETRTSKRRSDGSEETVVTVQKADGSEDVQPLDLFPKGDGDPFFGRTDDRFLADIFDNFFRKN